MGQNQSATDFSDTSSSSLSDAQYDSDSSHNENQDFYSATANYYTTSDQDHYFCDHDDDEDEMMDTKAFRSYERRVRRDLRSVPSGKRHHDHYRGNNSKTLHSSNSHISRGTAVTLNNTSASGAFDSMGIPGGLPPHLAASASDNLPSSNALKTHLALLIQSGKCSISSHASLTIMPDDPNTGDLVGAEDSAIGQMPQSAKDILRGERRPDDSFMKQSGGKWYFIEAHQSAMHESVHQR